MSGVQDSPASATLLLQAWAHGDRAALDDLMPIVHQELRQIARRHMSREPHGHTLQPTALVNEAYMRLIGLNRIDWRSRAHFLAMASRLMRRILVDAARARGCQKCGRGEAPLSFDESLAAPLTDRRLVALDDALRTLAALDPRKAQVVEMRFFSGLNAEETANVLHVSVDTVGRDWQLAKAWLRRELSEGTR